MDWNEFAMELAGMDPTELALGAGFIGILLTLFLVGSVLWFFISAIGYYKMFQKAGESGWKAFIPYYRSYIFFKLAWNPKSFLIYLVCLLLFQILSGSEALVLSLVALAGGIVSIVMGIKLDLRVAKSFGKTAGWGVLLYFFPFIVSLILGFGGAEYLGNTTVADFDEM